MHSTISLYKTSEAANVDLKATIHMDIKTIGTNIASSRALKWMITSGTSSNVGSVLASGDFIGVNSGDVLDLISNLEVTTTEAFYTIWIWLDASENPSNDLTGETLDTVVWTEINQTEDIEDRFEITRVNADYQSISAIVIDNKKNITYYNVTTTNEEPSTWIEIDNQDNIYNFEYRTATPGTYYIWFKDSQGRVVSKSATVIAMKAIIDCTNKTYNGSSQVACTCTGGTIGGEYYATNYRSTPYVATCTADTGYAEATDVSWTMNKKVLTLP